MLRSMSTFDVDVPFEKTFAKSRLIFLRIKTDSFSAPSKNFSSITLKQKSKK